MSIPVLSPTLRAIEEAGGVEVSNRKQGVRKITGDRLRILSTDTVLAIAEKFGKDRVADLLNELCEATTITNGGREIADNRTRLAALTLALAYIVGRPVERQEIVQVNLDADSAHGLAERLRTSPALRTALRAALDSAETMEVESVETSVEQKNTTTGSVGG